MNREPEAVRAAAATLREAAGWFLEHEDVTITLREVATAVESNWDDICCPLCEEVICDTGCALEAVRGKLNNANAERA